MGRGRVGGSARKIRTEDEGTCGKGLIRSYLYVFNVFLLIASLLVGGLGVWTLLEEMWFMPKLSSALSYPLTSYLLLVAGGVGLLSAMIGCCGIARSDKCFLLIYVLLLVIVFLLQVMAGGLAYFYRDHAPKDLEGKLNITFLRNYYGRTDNLMDLEVDQMQKEFKCCGPSFYDDWEGSEWVKSGANKDNKVPDSCCKTESVGCGIRDHPSNIYHTGCIHRLLDRVQTHLGYHAIVGLGICLLQLFGVVFSLCLYVKIKEDEAVDL